jgi:enoyl-CoA hydratase
MSERLVTYESHQGIAKIGLNDPSRLNVLSAALVIDLNQALDSAVTDLNNAVIILYGHGRAFCAGGDLQEFVGISSSPKNDLIKSWEYLDSCRLPVIAAVHGYTLGGGCELMLMADYVVAANNALFSQPELGLGFIPGCGAMQRLSQRIGYANTFDLIASTANITSENAYALGLVDRVTGAFELALTWAKQGRNALINLKAAMQSSHIHARRLFYEMVASDHAQRRIQQFLNKRVI